MNSIDECFTQPLLRWFDKVGRQDLPWQHPRTAYRVWLSEVMLQQTQVVTVIHYFNRFIAQFPTLSSLAHASEEEVLALWSGLGYYSRARNLYKTAQIVYHQYQGEFPKSMAALNALPGIGQSTAAAISAQAYNQPNAILDANVKRVLSRYYLIGKELSLSQIDQALWKLADLSMDKKRCVDYTQAIMDLGALCCTSKNPQCTRCPVSNSCQAYLANKVNDYPIKKAKKLKPIQIKQFLLIFNNQGQVYLEKRPPIGIWGSLWAVPIIDDNDNISDYINDIYGFVVNEPIALPAYKHSFSHFHLQIKPWLLSVNTSASLVKELPGQWIGASNLIKFGLPKPISSLIALGQAFLEN